MRKFARKAFSDYLLATNLTLGSGFMLAGDVLAQKVTRASNDEAHNWKRTKNMAIMGTGFGVLGHFWYSFLDRRFPGKTWAVIRSKLLAECAATPAFAGYTFVSYGILQGKNLQSCGHDFKEKLHLVCIADWFGYVPLQAINFYYVSPQYRFLFVCNLAVLYDCFLAWLLNKPHSSAIPSEENEPSDQH
ncbi:mpv17-like protein 2 [Varroa jacobsoni]|uniref:Mpv17-like protein 2 n=1 Tax=Varroa destructor TaxID=109461 RepID=A0A7M7MCT1_VARDE|nr:mpv17-like protein 2 [Varroa destructor]XP_022666852.1 mpv17-like protein 2 [Varroa destructor]XP_022697302.1 mpv17-like protein 2 [Varroa jacobsoni]XP_022697303.1 mpv17-like protein 2 [Varroa jacobsoni]XP_022697304.1 mpv17-like protein 2 [Varroa jacobsoni]XP_022697305.1 mpv17-like protein 2 [Varroa jacobsoni]